MKKILLFCSALGMLLLSCSKDPVQPNGTDPQDQSLTFLFEGMGKGALTYGIATDLENQVDDLDVYMFEYSATQDGAFKKKFVTGEYTLTKSGTQHTLKIENILSYGSADKTFYFVANATPTTDLDATGLTEKQFAELLTEEVDATSGKAELLTAPLLFTGKTASAVKVNATSAQTVPMKRRVARFDIVNPYDNFVIEKVFVSDAKLQGFAFGNALNTASVTFNSASLQEIIVDDPTCYETIDTERIAQHVFYTYPTKMGETTIAIQANLDGKGSQLYYVESDLEIKPNYRYKMTVTPNAVGQVRFILNYVDWDTDEHVDVEKRKALKVDTYEVDGNATHTNWDATNKIFELEGNTATKLTFVAHNAVEVKEEFFMLEGDWSDVTGGKVEFTKTPVFTYGATMAHEYEVTLPTQSGANEFGIKMRVSNKANPSEFQDIYFYVNVPIHLQYQYIGVLWGMTSWFGLAPSIVPNGMRVYAMENMDASLDYDDGTLAYEVFPSADAAGMYNTLKKNTTSSWTFVSVPNSDEVHWTDNNPNTGTSNLANLYVSAKADPDRGAGFYKPFKNRMMWNLKTFNAGAAKATPEVVKLEGATVAVTLKNAQNIPNLINSANPPVLDNSKIWVKMEKVPVSLSLGTGKAAFPTLSNPDVTEKYGTFSIAGFTGGSTLNSATWSIFGTAPESDPDYNKVTVRIMYENTVLHSFGVANITNTHHVYTVDFNDIVNVIVEIKSGGWTVVPIEPEF